MSDRPAEKNYAFMVILTVYSALKQPSKGKSTIKKQKKSMKMKELLFQLNEVNYIEFLESICYSMGGLLSFFLHTWPSSEPWGDWHDLTLDHSTYAACFISLPIDLSQLPFLDRAWDLDLPI